MAYTPTYTGSDLGNLFIDLFGTIVKGLVDNAPTLVILLIVALIGVYGKQALSAIWGVFRGMGQ
jgi:hypothetical protein